MRSKKPCPSRNKLSKIFTGEFCQFSTVRKTPVTDVVIDWPLPDKILDCVAAKNIRLRIKIVE